MKSLILQCVGIVGVVALFIGYTAKQVAHAQEVKEAIDAGEL